VNDNLIKMAEPTILLIKDDLESHLGWIKDDI